MRSLLLLLIMTELAYLVETVIYIFLGSYQYYPKIIKYNAYYDSNMGALTSNLLTVPILATFIATFELNWIWIIALTGLLAGIEWLFIELQIYVLYWWRIIYTSLGLILVYFPLAKVLYQKILQPLKGFLHSFILFLCIAPISGTFHILPIMLLANRVYLPGWFEDPARDTTAFESILYVGISILLVIFTKLQWKYSWLKYVLVLALLSAISALLRKAEILQSFVWWDPWYYLLFPLSILKLSTFISRRLSLSLSTDPSTSKKLR